MYRFSSVITNCSGERSPSAKHAIKKHVPSCFIVISELGNKNLGTGAFLKKNHAPNAVSLV